MVEYRAGNEAERQAGDFWNGEARGFGGHLPQLMGRQRRPGNDNIQKALEVLGPTVALH